MTPLAARTEGHWTSAATTAQVAERRAWHRSRTCLPATLVAPDGSEQAAMILDLSAYGALIETSSAPFCLDGWRLAFDLLDQPTRAPLQVVRWSPHSEAFLWGCRLDLPLAHARLIRQALSVSAA